MRLEQYLHLRLRMPKETIRRFRLRPALAGLRDLRLRARIKIARNCQQPSLQPTVRQIDRAKFLLRPIPRRYRLTGGRTAASPYRGSFAQPRARL